MYKMDTLQEAKHLFFKALRLCRLLIGQHLGESEDLRQLHQDLKDDIKHTDAIIALIDRLEKRQKFDTSLKDNG